MDFDNDDFIQKHFPDADKENIFRSSDVQMEEDTTSRIVGLYHN